MPRTLSAGRVPRADRLFVFPSELGWMLLAAWGDAVSQLSIAHRSADAAMRAAGSLARYAMRERGSFATLVDRLQAYAEGTPVDFDDVPIVLDHYSPFQRKVVDNCRAIPRGQTLSYGELARAAGAPRAARAVGSVMASNRIALIVPCHRVVHSGGGLGGYSAGAGVTLKRRLLALEAHSPTLAARG